MNCSCERKNKIRSVLVFRLTKSPKTLFCLSGPCKTPDFTSVLQHRMNKGSVKTCIMHITIPGLTLPELVPYHTIPYILYVQYIILALKYLHSRFTIQQHQHHSIIYQMRGCEKSMFLKVYEENFVSQS